MKVRIRKGLMAKKTDKISTLGKGEIVLYQSPNGKAALDVRLEGATLWLSLNQMAGLFERDKSVISRHLGNVFKTGELERNSVVAFFATTAADGKTYKVEYFNPFDRYRTFHLAKHFVTDGIPPFSG
jgi:hypothetical protein